MHSHPSHAAEIRQVAVLVEALGGKSIVLRRCDYDPAFFGSFQLEFAKGHKRARLTWDGRERLLSIERATVQSQSASAQWRTLQELKQESSGAALSEVESQVLSALSSDS
jgi:YD repeat-containing protein